MMTLLLTCEAFAGGRWRKYENCRLIESEYHDGDSFHVGTKQKHFIFRIYFVDAPEKDMIIPERVGEQAEYWGTNEETVLKIAREAREFTRLFLSEGFTVYTRKEDARGRSRMPRYFALVRVGNKYLCEALVENGYARIYGAWTDLPDGTNMFKFLAHLRALEKQAKKEKKGGWSRK